MEAELIPKEEVVNYHFIPADKSLSDVTKEKLNRALRLGNEYKRKTQITFLTDEGPKKIETTVWTLGENYIQIKGSISIPISSLIHIEEY